MKKILMMTAMLMLLTGIANGKERIKVACFGNSITEGSGVTDRITDSYPGVLQTLLGPDYEVRNFGISGHTLMLRSDRPLMRTELFNRALAWNPDIVTIKLGSNDAKRQNDRFIDTDYAHDLAHMADLLAALPSRPRIYLCTPAPATAIAYNINDSIIVNKEIPLIRKVAEEKGLEVIDLHESLQPHAALFPDHVHPNEAGAIVLAGEIYKALQGKDAPEYTRPTYPGIRTTEEGYDTYTFPYWGRTVTVTLPADPKEKDNIWMLRTATGPLSATDKALLEQGYVIASYDIAGDLGNADSTEDFKRLADRLTKAFPLDPKQVTVEGSGLGAAAALAGAAAIGGRLSMLLLEDPIADILTWAKESPQNMERMLETYGLWKWDEARASYKFKDNVEKLGNRNATVVFVSDAGVIPSAAATSLADSLRDAGCLTVTIDQLIKGK